MIEGLEMVQVALPSEREQDLKIVQGAKELSQIYRAELAANRLSQAKPNSPGKQQHQDLGSSHPQLSPQSCSQAQISWITAEKQARPSGILENKLSDTSRAQ